MVTPTAALKVPFLDLKAQYESIRDEVDAAIAAVIHDSAFIGGPYVQQFEERFADYCGQRHSVGVANGTDAIFIALRALGVGPGDEVITAANTFIATAEAITLAGATPVFVDIDPETCLIDAARIAEKVTARTRAVIPVHLYGHPADMSAISEVARRHGLFVVGDAAQAHGAEYCGRPVSALADVTCFSFYPGKNLGAYGDGGALVTNDAGLADRARTFANHGRTSTHYTHDVEGINSRLDGLQAAVLDVKLRCLPEWTEQRRAVAARYRRALEHLPIRLPVESDEVRAVYHLYVIQVPAARRDDVRQALTAADIQTGIHYPVPVPHLGAYRRLGHRAGEFPHAERAATEILSIPLFPEMTMSQIAHVTGTIAEAVRGIR